MRKYSGAIVCLLLVVATANIFSIRGGSIFGTGEGDFSKKDIGTPWFDNKIICGPNSVDTYDVVIRNVTISEPIYVFGDSIVLLENVTFRYTKPESPYALIVTEGDAQVYIRDSTFRFGGGASLFVESHDASMIIFDDVMMDSLNYAPKIVLYDYSSIYILSSDAYLERVEMNDYSYFEVAQSSISVNYFFMYGNSTTNFTGASINGIDIKLVDYTSLWISESTFFGSTLSIETREYSGVYISGLNTSGIPNLNAYGYGFSNLTIDTCRGFQSYNFHVHDSAYLYLSDVEVSGSMNVYGEGSSEIYLVNTNATTIDAYDSAFVDARSSYSIGSVYLHGPLHGGDNNYGSHANITDCSVMEVDVYASGEITYIVDSDVTTLYHGWILRDDAFVIDGSTIVSGSYEPNYCSISSSISSISNLTFFFMFNASNSMLHNPNGAFKILNSGNVFMDGGGIIAFSEDPFYLYNSSVSIVDGTYSMYEGYFYDSNVTIYNSSITPSEMYVYTGGLNISHSNITTLGRADIRISETNYMIDYARIENSDILITYSNGNITNSFLEHLQAMSSMYLVNVTVNDADIYARVYGDNLNISDLTESIFIYGGSNTIDGGIIDHDGSVSSGIVKMTTSSQINIASYNIYSAYIYNGDFQISNTSFYYLYAYNSNVTITNIDILYGMFGYSNITIKGSNVITMYLDLTDANISDSYSSWIELYNSSVLFDNVSFSEMYAEGSTVYLNNSKDLGNISCLAVLLTIRNSTAQNIMFTGALDSIRDALLSGGHIDPPYSELNIYYCNVGDIDYLERGTIKIYSSNVSSLLYLYTDVDKKVEIQNSNFGLFSKTYAFTDVTQRSGINNNVPYGDYVETWLNFSSYANNTVICVHNVGQNIDISDSYIYYYGDEKGQSIFGYTVSVKNSSFRLIITEASTFTTTKLIMNMSEKEFMFKSETQLYIDGCSIYGGKMSIFSSSIHMEMNETSNKTLEINIHNSDGQILSSNLNSSGANSIINIYGSQITINDTKATEIFMKESGVDIIDMSIQNVIMDESNVSIQNSNVVAGQGYISVGNNSFLNMSNTQAIILTISDYQYNVSVSIPYLSRIDATAIPNNITNIMSMNYRIFGPDTVILDNGAVKSGYGCYELMTNYTPTTKPTGITMGIIIEGFGKAKIENFTSSYELGWIIINTIHDTEPPNITINNVDEVFELGAPAFINFTIYDETPNKYYIYVDDNLYVEDQYTSGQFITIDLSPYISTAGNHTLNLTATDLAGYSGSYTTTINAQTPSSPLIEILNVTEEYETGYMGAILNLSIWDASDGEYWVYDNQTEIIHDSFSRNGWNILINLSQYVQTVGIHNITILANDSLGLSSNKTIWISVIPQAPPTIEILELTDQFELGVDAIIKIRLYDLGGGHYTILLNETIVGEGDFYGEKIVQVLLSELISSPGKYIINITAIDNSGASTQKTESVTVYPSELPEITLLPSDTYSIEVGQNITLNWTATDRSPDIYNISINGTEAYQGTWKSGIQVSYTFSPQEPGIYIISITFRDKAGNTAMDEVRIDVVEKTSSPTATTTTTTSGVSFEPIYGIIVVSVIIIVIATLLFRKKKKTAEG